MSSLKHAKDRTDRLLKALAVRVLAAPEARDAFAFQEKLAESQWYSRDHIEAYQLGHLKILARHAAREVPHYRSLPIAEIDRTASVAEVLSHIPILPRDRLATEPEAFRATALPQGQRRTGEERSSGSIGQMVRIETTNLHYGWQNALNFRAHLWAGRDFAKPIAVVRKMADGMAPPPEGVRQAHWDAPTVIPVESAASWFLNTSSATLDEIWDWLGRVKPAYLMTYPSILRELARQAAGRKRLFTLSGVTTIGETVDDELRALSATRLAADVHDIYSANEIGNIAIQCPACRRYHAQAEALIVEIVDNDGQTCAPGGKGRVLLTPLFNFATPLLRYDIGDYAEQGPPCACGRGLPTINRILGRTRNMLTTPDGKLYWPALSNKVWQKIMPIRKFQLRQVALDRIEVWLVTQSPVTKEQKARMSGVLAASLPAPYRLDFHYVEDIPAGPGGKFEQVLNGVARA